MKICIYGAGAIGGYLGVQLARAGADISLVARGPHLAAMRENGLKLLGDGEERVVHFTIDEEKLKFFNAKLEYAAEPGDFTVQVGLDSEAVREQRFVLE